MKHDANSIVREHGVAHLRRAFDQAPMFETPLTTADADRDIFPATPDHRPRFVPVAIDDVTMSAEPAWLIDGLLPARGLACVVGPPKSGKSFLTTDMLFSVARSVPYAGRETIPGPVVYLTGEGVNGFKRRLVAMRRHHDAEGTGTPFYMVDNVPDLGSEHTDLPRLLVDLDAFIAQRAPEGVRAIVLDTLARCMGEADENAARDMGRFINRCSAIERHFKCLVAVVHHAGKDPSRGGRGSNSLNGAADVTMMVEKTENFSTVRVDEMKDGPEGQEWRFRLVPYLLSETSDITSETSCEVSTCVVELLSQPSVAKPRETKKVKAPKGVTGDLLKVIRRAVEEAGERNVESVAAPNNVRAVSKANLKRYCTTMDLAGRRGQTGFVPRHAQQEPERVAIDRLHRLRPGLGVAYMRTPKPRETCRNLAKWFRPIALQNATETSETTSLREGGEMVSPLARGPLLRSRHSSAALRRGLRLLAGHHDRGSTMTDDDKPSQLTTAPTRQAEAIEGRSLPLKITGKLRIAIEQMVWHGARRAEAAEKAGLKDHSLRAALRKTHVMAHYHAELGVLRESTRAKNFHRLDGIAEDSPNTMARVAAIKTMEAVSDPIASVARGQALAGWTIDLSEPSSGLSVRIVSPAPQPQADNVIDITPNKK